MAVHDLFTRCLHQIGPALEYKIRYTAFQSATTHIIMMFNTELSNAGHSRRFMLGHVPLGGWELLIEEDNAVVSRVHYTDWHRVERALAAVTRRISELEAGGWRALVRHETGSTTT